jgi:transposase
MESERMSRRSEYLERMKKQLVEEALSGGNASFVARKHGVDPNTLTKWIRQYRDEVESEMSKKQVPKAQDPQVKETVDYKKKYEQAVKLLGEKDVEIAILRDLLKKTRFPDD